MNVAETLAQTVQSVLADKVASISEQHGELALLVQPEHLLASATLLRDEPRLRFEQLVDLCAVDYSDYGNGSWDGRRFAVVYHLLSLTHNRRLRLRVFAADDEYPRVASILPVWPAANWFEREAFDFFGVVFDGHPDLRRLLTDYGFIGHPFRKDFPLSGNVEMRYDPDQQRVIYQPVTIEPREITPRVIREDQYAR